MEMSPDAVIAETVVRLDALAFEAESLLDGLAGAVGGVA